MNNNIRKLIEHAGADEIGADLYGGDFIGAIRLDFLEKFARAIVKECLVVGSKAEHDGLVWWSDAVQEHFDK